MTVELHPQPWVGRNDGPGPEHRRWHHAVNESMENADTNPAVISLIGFRSDEGVRRNNGRPGAASAPTAIRQALASLSALEQLQVTDLGDICVTDTQLEQGQERLGHVIAKSLQHGQLPIVLGGGHETAFGSYLGLTESGILQDKRLGIINLDAHFDLRNDPVPSSGTPFRQMADIELASGNDFIYRIIGISEANNTLQLFQTAARLGVEFITDEDSGSSKLPQVAAFVDRFLDEVDAVYLTIDLDVLPAHVAPGVSAPAALGVPLEVILAICRQLARSPKLLHVDVVELNPLFDIDNQTARAAARLIHSICAEHTAVMQASPVVPASTPQPGIEPS